MTLKTLWWICLKDKMSETDNKAELFGKYPERYRVKISELPSEYQENIYLRKIDSQNRRQSFSEEKQALVSDPEFDVSKAIEERKGPFVEIAGPTEDGFELVDVGILDKKLIVTNIEPGLPLWSLDGQKFIVGHVDQQVDATNMPYKGGSIGIILCAALNLGEVFFKEAKRVLEPGGLLILDHLGSEYPEQIANLGFKNVRLMAENAWHKESPEEKQLTYAGIWVKL